MKVAIRFKHAETEVSLLKQEKLRLQSQNLLIESREGQSESAATPERSPARVDDEDLEAGEINSPELSSDDKNDESELVEEAGDGADKLIDVNEPISVESNQVAVVASEGATLTSAAESSSSKVNLPVPKPNETEEAKQASPISSTSTTINLSERARERSQMRQAGLVPSLPRPRGGRLGNPPRGRVARGGRGGGRRPLPPAPGPES
ncbi:uncharacterized protein LOC109790976 [Cajanus cajan]|uniref:uncharacterized protein LOC109790976 n=1 Tax=Cajanus cajan TaxID=3821 RepID=UPI00098D99D3|nr:uncharacterized protein LOC109790976 [Cajanus cajan]